MNIAQLLAAAAKTFPDRPAVSVGFEVRLSYRQLHDRVTRLAAGLLALPGMAPGSRVMLYMGNCPQYVEVLFSLWHAGLCAVPINAKLHPREAAFILDNSAAMLCLSTTDTAEAAAAALTHCGGNVGSIVVGSAEYEALLAPSRSVIPQHTAHRDELAWVFYTSGTTGRPKGAMLSHGNLHAMAQAYLCDVDQVDEFDALLHLGPQSHAAGLFCLAHIAKGTNQVLPASGGFDIDETIDLVNHYPQVTFFAAPTMLRRILDSAKLPRMDVSHLRTILCGAAPIYPGDVRAALKAFGLRFWNGYGQGETPLTITAMPKHLYRDDGSAEFEERLVSVGIARTGVEVRVADEAGNELPPGEIGEILVRGDVVMSGYLNNSEATAAALKDSRFGVGRVGCCFRRRACGHADYRSRT